MTIRKWKTKLDVSDVWMKKIPIEEKSTIIAGKIRAKFPALVDENNDFFDPELLEIVEHLESVTGYDEISPVEEFDDIWYGFYNWADDNRVWVQTT